MKYKQAIEFLYKQLPMYQRIGKAAFKKDLKNIRKLLAAMGQPHTLFPSIHIAGTNGKGSTSHLLAAVFQAHGYKVGIYTSPHYKDFRERIKINGKLVGKRSVSRFVENYQSLWDKVKPSFFEITVAMAFEYFARNQVDIAIIETGLGGRLDSTNVLQPILSVITNIAFDHTDMLGDILEQIAGEKAGIIKKEVPVVIGQKHPETYPVFIKKAKQEHAPVVFSEDICKVEFHKLTKEYQHFSIQSGDGVQPILAKTDLFGLYQLDNIRTTISACKVIQDSYPEWRLNWSRVHSSFRNIISSTYFIGRWQYIDRQPDILCDSAHNPSALRRVFDHVSSLKYHEVKCVIGFTSGKDIEAMLSCIPTQYSLFIAKPNVPRGLDIEKVVEIALKMGRKASGFSSIPKALAAAKVAAKKEDLIYVGGSSFVVAEVI